MMAEQETDSSRLYKERIERIRGDLIVAMKDHETEDHGGHRCSDERANLIGYFLHILGITKAEIITALVQAAEYNRTHERIVHGQE